LTKVPSYQNSVIHLCADIVKFLLIRRKGEMVSKLKRTPTEWEKTFPSYTSGKGLITRIYRELKNLNSPQINEPIKK
jgi:hypothetical protein